jgi:hypothetical protein
MINTEGLRSPLSPAALRDLFFRPAKFFREHSLDAGDGMWAAWAVGLAIAIERIDQGMARSELGASSPGWDALSPFIANSWPGFWLFAILMGAVGGALAWVIGGWWYHRRIRWSGVPDADRTEARRVYIFTSLVAAVPIVTYAMLATVVYPDYSAAWYDDEIWSGLLLIFPFWSVAVSYRGVRARFPIRAGPARIWFAIFPVLFYVVMIGVIGLLFSFVQDSTPPTPAPIA